LTVINIAGILVLGGDVWVSFDKGLFAKLLKKARGSRSINKYASESDVTAAHISRLLREKIDTPPNPGTIKKLANAAHNNVTYEDLMTAAGHIVTEKEMNTHKKNIDLTDLIENDTIELTVYGRPITQQQKEGLIKYIKARNDYEGEVHADSEGNHFAAHDDGEEILILKPDLAELIKASQKINVMLQKYLDTENKNEKA